MSTAAKGGRMALRIPEVPRMTSGFVLAAGGIGYALGADVLTAEVISSLAIVGVAATALVVSGALDRHARVSRVGRRASSAEVARQFHRELLRARRLGTTLTVARFPGLGLGAGGQRSLQRRVADLRRHLRRIDLVWVRGNDIYLLLPETDAEAASGALDRLRERVPAAFAPAEPTVVLFPRDGMTSGAILAAVAGRAPLGPAPAPPAPERSAPPRAVHGQPVTLTESRAARIVPAGLTSDPALEPSAASRTDAK